MLKKRILASSMASVMALSGISVAAFADEETTKKYGEAVTKEELQAYIDSLQDFIDNKLENFGTVQTERFETVIDYAGTVLEDSKATDKDFTAAYQLVKNVKDSLVIKTAAELKALVKSNQNTYDTNNELNIEFNDVIYTDSSWTDFSDAFNEAERYSDSDNTQYITDAYLELEEAAGKLEALNTVTKKEFEQAMVKYQNIATDMQEYEPWRRGTLTVAPKTGTSSNKGNLKSKTPAISMADLKNIVYGDSKVTPSYLEDGKWKVVEAEKISTDDEDAGHNAGEGKWIGNFDVELTVTNGTTLFDFINKKYEEFTKRKGVTVTSDPAIVAACEAALDAVDVYNGWEEDGFNRGGEGNCQSLLRKYHNQLVDEFNLPLIDNILAIDSLDDGKFEYNTAKRELTCTKTVYVVVNKNSEIVDVDADGDYAEHFYEDKDDAEAAAGTGDKVVTISKNKTNIMNYLPTNEITIERLQEVFKYEATKVEDALMLNFIDSTPPTDLTAVKDNGALATAQSAFKTAYNAMITSAGWTDGGNTYKLLYDVTKTNPTNATDVKKADGTTALTDVVWETYSNASGSEKGLKVDPADVKLTDAQATALEIKEFKYTGTGGSLDTDAAGHNAAVAQLRTLYGNIKTAQGGATKDISGGHYYLVDLDGKLMNDTNNTSGFSSYVGFEAKKEIADFDDGASPAVEIDVSFLKIVKTKTDSKGKLVADTLGDTGDDAAIKAHNKAIDTLKKSYDRLKSISGYRTSDMTIWDRMETAKSDYDTYAGFEDLRNDSAEQTAAEAIMDRLTEDGPQLKGYTESRQEWTLIWRQLAYALDDMYPEEPVTSHTLKELKALIDGDAVDALDKTADTQLFQEKHDKLVDQRKKAIDYYAEKKVDPKYKPDSELTKMIDDLESAIDKLNKQYNDFKYSYGDIRDTIAEVAAALDANEVSGDALVKALADTALRLANHEASNIYKDDSKNVDNNVFDDYGEFQYANRLKTNNKEFDKIKPNQYEKDLLKSYDALVAAYAAAKAPVGEKTNDLNGDGKVNVLDVQALLKVAVDGTTDLKYDINDDKSVNVLDVQALLKIALAD